MELNSKLLACIRKTKAFRSNFEKLLAIVQCNQVKVMTASEFRVIDIIVGHVKPIKSIDISQISKTIVSYSQNLLIVHTLIKDSSVQMDQTIFSGQLKWKENWRCEIKYPIRNLNLSQIGDFLTLSGQGVISVWTRDNEVLQSFSNIIHYSKEEAKDIFATVIKQVDIGDVMQQEITTDGRLIIYLEHNSKSVKVLYQDKISEPIKSEKELKKEELAKSQNYKPQQKVVAPIQDFNPYANLVPLTEEEESMARQNEVKFKIEDLFSYSIPEHKNNIDYFKIMYHDIMETERKYLPNVVLTVTCKNEIYIWQENLASSEMQFTCVHMFRGNIQTPFFDVSFVEFPPVNPKLYHETPSQISKIFDTSSDQVLRLKKDENNRFGIYKPNSHEKSIDWILILKDHILESYKVECLRNFPCRNISISQFNRIRMNSSPRDFHGVCKIFSSSCRDLNDVISIYCLNSQFQLLKFRKNFVSNQDFALNSHNPLSNHHQWKLDKLNIINQRNIREVLVHSQLPFVAYIMSNDEIYFFIEEQSTLQLIPDNQMKFAGAYSIHHQSHHIHQHGGDNNHFIKKAKWVKGLCQMMILFSNNTVGLLSSHSLLRILASAKHPEEYLKIWEEKKGLISERWDRLYEIEFSPDNGKQNELIVDFEIIDTNINTEDGVFVISLAIFTDQYQLYVYQIETKFLSPGLKSISSSTLLLSMQTDDSMLRMLASYNNFDNQNRTCIAMLTEIDPATAPAPKPIEVVVEEAPKKKGKFAYDFDDDDDSDGGDIFSAVSSKPKQEKKKQVQLIYPPAPTKREVRIKLVSFEMNEQKNGVTIKDEWKVEVDLGYKVKDIVCKINRDLIGFMVKEGESNDQILYIYEITSSRYLGFVNLSELLKVTNKNSPIDYLFSCDKVKGSIIVFSNNNLYLISQSAKSGMPGKWSVISLVKQVTGLDFLEIQTAKMTESNSNKLFFLINEKYIKIKSKFNLQEIRSSVINKIPMNQAFAHQQKSFALYDQKLLKALYIKGYSKLVLKILVKLQQAILFAPPQMQQVYILIQTHQISDFLDFDIEQLYDEIQLHIADVNAQTAGIGQVKKENAASLFDDFYGGGNDDYGASKEKPQEEENKGTGDDKKLEMEFDDNFNKFLEALKQKNVKQMLGLKSKDQVKEYVIFLKKFQSIRSKEFFAGPLADVLLRELFYDTEEVVLEDEPERMEAPLQNQPINIMAVLDSMRAMVQLSRGSIDLLTNWSSFKCQLALVSENQDVIVNEISTRFDFENNFNWKTMKKLCIPIWLKDISKLKMFTEKVAKGEYKSGGDDFGKQSRAERTALWYVLLGKKQQLCSLYKIEPQYKKIYELLLNDFNEKKYQITAGKNAMVLMSRRNFLLAAAFFLLAQDIKSAMQIALGRLNDPILAVLILRLMEGEESETLKQVYQDHFIQRGETLGDPYLVSTGHWLRKDYIKSMNAFKIEGGGGSNLHNLLKPGVASFDIGFITELEEEIKVITIEDAQKNAQGKLDMSEKIDPILPLPVSYDYYTLEVLRAMKKLPAVKRELNKKQAPPSFGGGGDAFDFFGSETKVDKAKEEEEKKKQEENKLTVDESKIVQLVAYDQSQSGLPVVSLIIMSENKEFMDNVEGSFKSKIAKTILNDLSHSFSQFLDFNTQVKKANSSIAVLGDNFSIDEEAGKTFIIKQCDQMGLIGLEISFFMDLQKEDVTYRLEDYALKLIDFVHAITDFPFIIDASTNKLKADGKEEKNKLQTEKMLEILSNLEQIVECLLGLTYRSQTPFQENDMDEHKQTKQINTTSGVNREVGFKRENANSPSKVALSHAKSTRTYTMNDPDNDGINYQFKIQGEGQIQFQDQKSANKLIGSQDLALGSDLDKILIKLNAKIRTILIVYISLIEICFATRKFQFVASLLSVLRTILNYQQAGSSVEPLDQKLEKAFNIDYQKLKIKIQKIKYSISPQVEVPSEEKKNEEEEYQTTFEMAGGTITEEQKQIALQEQRVVEFFSLWFRYIIAYNTSFVLKNAYQDSQIQNLINLRPSIITNRKIQEIIITIINQKLQAGELLKKMENKYRILENVTSYYFEQFLNMNDRKNVVSSLMQSKDSDFKKNIPNAVMKLFDSEKQFYKFAHFMDLKTFVQYLKEHELSLVYHTYARDAGNQSAVDRTKEIFSTGIDLFRLKGDPVQSFAFDRSGRDIAVLAMLNKGIREIPIQKTLLCRNRMNNGLTLVDEELNNWNECLHRYDKYPIPNSNNDPIIAVIDKIYRQKTIHFIRTDKRKKTNTLIDYEVSPPDFWGGQKMNDYMRPKSNLDILHEDYSYAVESHPFLPLYITGNAKGLLNLWAFEQDQDRSLDQWITQHDQKNAIPKKATIKKLQFSQYGDKISALNMEGSFFTYNFDSNDSSKVQPMFHLRKTKEQKFNDFEYLNSDTVLAMSSLKPKKLWIFDTLIPQKQGLVVENNMGGNLILSSKVRQQIFTFNERPGQVNIYDIRAQKQLPSIQLHTDEVTAVTINDSNDSVVAGFKDGTVKIFNIARGDFETRESQVMFQAMGNKKGGVSQVRLNPNNGALYAASITGNFKLLRTKV